MIFDHLFHKILYSDKGVKSTLNVACGFSIVVKMFRDNSALDGQVLVGLRQGPHWSVLRLHLRSLFQAFVWRQAECFLNRNAPIHASLGELSTTPCSHLHHSLSSIYALSGLHA